MCIPMPMLLRPDPCLSCIAVVVLALRTVAPGEPEVLFSLLPNSNEDILRLRHCSPPPYILSACDKQKLWKFPFPPPALSCSSYCIETLLEAIRGLSTLTIQSANIIEVYNMQHKFPWKYVFFSFFFFLVWLVLYLKNL